MFERIDHVGIAVAELDPALALYSSRFDCDVLRREVLEEATVEAALVRATTASSSSRRLRRIPRCSASSTAAARPFTTSPTRSTTSTRRSPGCASAA
jgi:methylmalonyl-CoA/ethylmalonyl-CoA epimerase